MGGAAKQRCVCAPNPGARGCPPRYSFNSQFTCEQEPSGNDTSGGSSDGEDAEDEPGHSADASP